MLHLVPAVVSDVLRAEKSLTLDRCHALGELDATSISSLLSRDSRLTLVFLHKVVRKIAPLSRGDAAISSTHYPTAKMNAISSQFAKRRAVTHPLHAAGRRGN